MLTYWIGKPIMGSGLALPKSQTELPNGHLEFEIHFGISRLKENNIVFYEVDPKSNLIVKARWNDIEYVDSS